MLPRGAVMKVVFAPGAAAEENARALERTATGTRRAIVKAIRQTLASRETGVWILDGQEQKVSFLKICFAEYHFFSLTETQRSEFPRRHR